MPSPSNFGLHATRKRGHGPRRSGRRGRIADMTTLMLPGGLAAVSSLPLAGQRAAPADYALRVDGEFVAAGRRGTAGSGACPSLVFSCPGRVACGAPAGAQIPALGRERSCRWPCRAGGDRASGVDVAAGPRSASQPGWGNRPVQSPASAGSRTARTVPARPAPASEPFRLMQPQLVQARGYRRQSLPFSSACLINGRVVTCSCWSRSAVLI
jgi:hypothetical protein